MQLNVATYTTGAAVTPSDSTAVSFRALYVGGTGALAVRTVGGDSLTFAAVPAGALIPIEVDRVLATGTAATNIVGLA